MRKVLLALAVLVAVSPAAFAKNPSATVRLNITVLPKPVTAQAAHQETIVRAGVEHVLNTYVSNA